MFGWFKKRRVQQAKDRYNEGYAYAAAALLKGMDTVSLECEIDGGGLFSADDEFEAGMQAALDMWLALHSEHDDNFSHPAVESPPLIAT